MIKEKQKGEKTKKRKQMIGHKRTKDKQRIRKGKRATEMEKRRRQET